ncbi:MAG: CARDB domain-containing protein, partial [Sedimenticola sp.]
MWISNNYLLKLRFLITLFLCMLFTAGITHAASPREKLSSKIIQNSGIVSTAVTLKPDLVVTRVTMSKDCRIQFTLKNTSKGGLADKFHRQGSVKIRVTGKTSKNYIIPFRIVDTRGLLKKAGGSVTYVSAINISKTAYVKVDVDPGNKIPELNETNNSRRIQLRPKCSTTKNKPQSRVYLKPDLVVTKVTMSKDCRIQFTLKNTSKGRLADKFHRQGSVKIRVSGKDPKNHLIPFRIVDTKGLLKKAGGSVPYVSAINIPKTAYVKIDVDPGNKIPELNETNNSRRIQLRPKCSTAENKPQSREYLKPDLIIDSFINATENPTVTDDNVITVSVRNQGPASSTASKLELKVGGEATPPKYDVPALASGATHTLRRHINLPIALTYLSIAKIDADNGNVESDETNNEAELIFAVSPPPRPDLIIDSFINATENPTVTDDNVITVSVRNQGPASSTASKLELKVGGEATPPKYDVPALA